MKVLNAIWQLPQNIAGYIVLKVTKAYPGCAYKDAVVFPWYRKDGISLGKYIFVPPTVDLDYVKHEYGHTIQSKRLGWLYLFVIGIPSIVWAGCFKSYRKKHNVSYYSFYTEKWADKLGGVERSKK